MAFEIRKGLLSIGFYGHVLQTNPAGLNFKSWIIRLQVRVVSSNRSNWLVQKTEPLNGDEDFCDEWLVSTALKQTPGCVAVLL